MEEEESQTEDCLSPWLGEECRTKVFYGPQSTDTSCTCESAIVSVTRSFKSTELGACLSDYCVRNTNVESQQASLNRMLACPVVGQKVGWLVL